MLSNKRPPEPWDSFLRDLDSAMTAPVRLDCFGGFVVTQLYGLERATADMDVIELAPREAAEIIVALALRGEHLLEMFPGAYRHLRLMALDPYDLALSKLERNGQKDRDDVRFLARTVPLDLEILEQQYLTELRWQLGVPGREDLTLRLWIEMIREDRHA